MDTYDIIVVGAGSAGLNIAGFMNTLGLRVLIIEKHLVGGDCLNTGCVPSKALISMARNVYSARKAGALGLDVSGKVDMEMVADTIVQRQDIIRIHETPEYLRSKGMEVEIGSPRFVSPDQLEINGRTVEARRFVIATGSRPKIPKIEGIRQVDFLTSESIFKNRELPEQLLVIGAGPIGIEMAQAYHRLGSRVSVIDMADRVLPLEDEEVSRQLMSVLEDEGIQFYLSAVPAVFTGRYTLTILQNDKHYGQQQIELDFHQILIAAGRKLNIDGLGLEVAGVKICNGKIFTDSYLRTTNKKILCCGDVAGDYQYTHWAEYQASVIIRNMLKPFKRKVDHSRIASVIYTDPEVASFGLSMEELTRLGRAFQTVTVPVKEVDMAVCEGDENGILIIHHTNDRILGGTLMAKHAGEIAGELIGYQNSRIPFSRLYQRIYPYPTMSRILRKAVQKHMGERLTPRATGILKKLYRMWNQ